MAVRRRTQGDSIMGGGSAFGMNPEAQQSEGPARREGTMSVSTTPGVVMPQIPDPPMPVPPPDNGEQGVGGGKGQGPRESSKPTGGAGTASLSGAPSIPTPNITGGGQTGVRRREESPEAPQATGQIPPPAPAAMFGAPSLADEIVASPRRREPRLFGDTGTGMPLFGKAGGLLGGGLGVPSAVSGGDTPDVSALIAALLRSQGRG